VSSIEPNESELWFDRYVAEHGQDPGDPEPDLGISRRPDRLITWNGDHAVCEVKEFGEDVVESTGGARAIGATVWYGPVREAVHRGARQMRDLAGSKLPLVVVLANPRGMFIPLKTRDVIYSLYGNPGYTFEVDTATGGAVTEPQAFAGRDGEITNDHPYLSGVLLLRHRTHERDFLDDLQADLAEEQGWAEDAKTTDEATRRSKVFLEAVDAASERGEIPEGDYLYADVIVAMSEQTQPLPPTVFDGPRDSRWEFDQGSGAYVRVRP
jgi:hypothetical protein